MSSAARPLLECIRMLHLSTCHLIVGLFSSTAPLRLQEQHLLLHDWVILEHAQWPRRAWSHHRLEVTGQRHRYQTDSDRAGFRCEMEVLAWLLDEGTGCWEREGVRFLAIAVVM